MSEKEETFWKEVKTHLRRKKGGKRKCVSVKAYVREIATKEDTD